ncbi:MAG: hypothetical protein Ct9H300mP14_11210 [Gammaproteobacteria bacterium]|nr:MAG: hypothetical protein Ct9H300mP14_11210 [Gammaproteobacteria bacterium]
MDRRNRAEHKLFLNVPVDTERTLEQPFFVPGHSVAGDYVELEAKMKHLLCFPNCPQVNNPCNGGNPTAIRIVFHLNSGSDSVHLLKLCQLRVRLISGVVFRLFVFSGCIEGPLRSVEESVRFFRIAHSGRWLLGELPNAGEYRRR